MGKVFNLKRLGKAALAALGVVAIVVFFFGVGELELGGFDRAPMTYHSLDYDAEVTPNGDLRLTEHIDAKLGKRDGKAPWRQLYQRYTLNDAPGKATDDVADDENTLGAITDVSVKNVTTGQTFRHGDPDSPNHLSGEHWDKSYAGTWYARDLGRDADDNEDKTGMEYEPAGMTSDEYDAQKRDDAAAQKQAQGQTQSKQSQQSGKRNHSKTRYSSDDWTPDTMPKPMGKARDVIEIGWNIPATTSAKSMKFDVTMTLKDVVKVYDDVAYLKWEPAGDNNGVLIERFHAKLTLPKGTKAGTTSQWMHYAGKGAVHQAGPRGIEMDAERVSANSHIDLVSMFGNQGMGQVRYRIHKAAKGDVAEGEEFEQQQAAQGQAATSLVLIGYVAIPVLIALGLGIAAVVASNRQTWISGDVDYVRDIPKITPGAAASFMDELTNNDGRDVGGVVGFIDDVEETLSGNTVESREMAATLLELASKKRIAIYPGEAGWYQDLDLSAPLREVNRQASVCLDEAIRQGGKADTVTIAVLPKESRAGGKVGELANSEKSLLAMLMDIALKLKTLTFDLREVSDRLGDWRAGAKKQERFYTSVDIEYDNGNYYTRLWYSYAVAVVLVLVGVFEALAVSGLAFSRIGFESGVYGLACAQLHGQWAVSLILGVVVIFGLAFVFKLLEFYGLTPMGKKVGTQLLGLRRYMQDFSDFSERDVADLALWDQYLVYATAFGMSAQVTKRMAQMFPSLTDAEWMNSNGVDSVLYWSYYPSVNGLGDGAGTGAGARQAFGGFGDFGSQLASGLNTIQSTFSAAAPSDSGGGGSSFSGSGGGSGGGSFGGR
ncbi:DUF2207 domain-containing protein [Bifidobacterium sp. ESL0790]|uniref:DUF2207 domain-containing protein n=1 Tax=Bifidobacterium sp. ESL0790 TaxID=2983233 RepID=UPI0023F70C79|nr:DUF2207 domain-containing protein [Bifidobacterium sp. ESL0790]WEV72226.1 DUF2207 domain-containing protein [Bifidobacterium sp. ESL0790]